MERNSKNVPKVLLGPRSYWSEEYRRIPAIIKGYCYCGDNIVVYLHFRPAESCFESGNVELFYSGIHQAGPRCFGGWHEQEYLAGGDTLEDALACLA